MDTKQQLFVDNYSFVRKMINKKYPRLSKETVDDLVQGVYITWMNKSADTDVKVSPRTQLINATIGHVLNFFDYNSRRVTTSPDFIYKYTQHVASIGRPLPDQAVHERKLPSLVSKKAKQILNKEQSKIIDAVIVATLTSDGKNFIKEVAESTNKTNNNVKVTLNSIRKKLTKEDLGL